jgi:phospholipase/lecithinase/hemolysin
MGLSLYIVALLSLASNISPVQAAFKYSDVKQVLSFGDSYSFVQGTYGQTNKTFIGSYVKYAYTASQLLNNQIVQNFTGTAEGGANWLERLTGCAVQNGSYSPANCSMALWNFAYSGASVGEQWLPKHTIYTIPLVNQTSRYLTYGDPVLRSKNKINKSTALVTIWIGVNDIFDSATYKPSNISNDAFWASEIDGVFQQSVQPLYNSGYKNFLFLNLPPLDRTPGNQRAATPYPSKAQVNSWGTLLANRTSAFQAQYADSKAMLYDANTFLNGVLDNPSKYGITRTGSYCPGWNQLDVLTNPASYGCSSMDKYFWYNAVHMSVQTHKVMAADLKAFLISQSSS